MLLWSYFSVVFTDPGGVPPNWKPVVDEENGDADLLAGSEFSQLAGEPANSRIRYCRKCNQLKPPRCHHCSVCKFAFFFNFTGYGAIVSSIVHLDWFSYFLQVVGVYWKWITIVFGLSIVSGHWTTSIFFFSWYTSKSEIFFILSLDVCVVCHSNKA